MGKVREHMDGLQVEQHRRAGFTGWSRPPAAPRKPRPPRAWLANWSGECRAAPSAQPAGPPRTIPAPKTHLVEAPWSGHVHKQLSRHHVQNNMTRPSRSCLGAFPLNSQPTNYVHYIHHRYHIHHNRRHQSSRHHARWRAQNHLYHLQGQWIAPPITWAEMKPHHAPALTAIVNTRWGGPALFAMYLEAPPRPPAPVHFTRAFRPSKMH